MIYHRKTIEFYWAHVWAFVTIFLGLVQTYYSLFWVPTETITSAWTFLILPFTLLSVVKYQIIPENYKKRKSEKFFFMRLKEILYPVILFNNMAIAKFVYYRWDQYLEYRRWEHREKFAVLEARNPFIVDFRICLIYDLLLQKEKAGGNFCYFHVYHGLGPSVFSTHY